MKTTSFIKKRPSQYFGLLLAGTILLGAAGHCACAQETAGDTRVVSVDLSSVPRQTNVVATLEGHTSWVTGVACSPNGETLFTASHDETARLWSLSDFKLLHTLNDPRQSLWNADFSTDGSMVISGGDDQCIFLWDASSGALTATYPPRPGQDWFEQQIFQEPTVEHEGRIEGVAFSPDGKRVIASGDGRKAVVWDVRTRKSPFQLLGHKASIHGVDFSPDGRWIATGDWNAMVRIWKAADGELVHSIEGLKSGVEYLMFSRDSSMLVCAVMSGQVLIVDPNTGREIRRIDGIKGGVMAVAISPDQKLIVAQAGIDAVILDVATGQPKVILAGHTATIDAVTFSPDSKWAITGGLDGKVKIWDISRFNAKESHDH